MGILNMLKSKMTGDTDAMIGTAISMLAPLMEQFTAEYDKPVEDGGLLEKEDYGCCFAVVKSKIKQDDGSDVFTHLPYVFVLAHNAENNQMFIRRRIPFLSLIAKKQETEALEPADSKTLETSEDDGREDNAEVSEGGATAEDAK